MKPSVALLAAALMACGGGEQAGQQAAQAAPTAGTAQTQSAPAAAAAATTGTVHEVKMELRNGQYLYDPAQLTIKVGDTVRWINVSGGPHNVAFYQDKIPAGAADVLNNAMANRLSPLSGPLLTDSLATYQVSFANAPAGTYNYYCLPHEALGMKGTITVQP
jgi:plastocyanin